MRKEQKIYPETHPLHQIRNARRMLKEVIDHTRSGATMIHDPKAQTLMETSAEVLVGLLKAYDDYEQKSEQACL